MRFGSVCSGIEAVSIAWEPLGWSAAWVSEIEAFPSAVLAHHWPDVPNLGDMLALPALVDAGEIEAPDVLVGGTPCQAFSVAGNRESLADARGGLTLAYVELADAIDRKRSERGEEPCIIAWENVPGVLSTKDNAFGCFLAGLAGEDEPLLPPGKRWTNAGVVLGPKRAIAWRILDAQYFGLAQRRRRVFVVASARDGFDPSQVLLEFEGVRRDSAPRREAGQETPGDAGPGFEVAGTLDSRVSGGGFPGSDGAMGGHVVPDQKWPAEIASTLNAAFGSKLGLEDQHINGGAPLFVPVYATDGQANAAFSENLASSLTAHNEQPYVTTPAIPILEPGARTGKSTTDVRAGLGVGDDGDPMFTLQAGKQHGVAFAQNTRDEVRLVGGDGSLVGALAAQPGMKQTSYVAVPPAVTVALRGREGGATAEVGGEVATALRASSGGGDKPHVLATMEVAGTMKACAGTSGGWSNSADHAAAGYMQVDHNMAVRRLTPTECERLQGFPDGHTDVPYRKKPAADGPRYKALGNSMAVPVMRWIGSRIQRHLDGDL